MSIRVYTTDIRPGIIVGNRGTGVKGSQIPSTGANGPALPYPFISLPADNDAEFSVEIVTWPTAGALFVYDDGSFTYDAGGVTDGTYPFTWTLRKNGAVVNTYTTNLIVGEQAATVGVDLAGSFAVVTTVGTTLAASFAVQQAVGAALAGSFAVVAPVGVSLSGTFSTLAAVGAELAGSFAVIAPVKTDLAGSFAVQQAVGVALSGAFDVEQPGVVAVDLAGSFAVASTAGADLSGAFAVSSAVGKDLAGQFAVAQAVGTALPGSFDVLETVAAVLAGTFGVEKSVGTTLAGTFTVASQGGGADPSQVWAFVLPNGKSAAQTLMDLETMVLALYRIHGLEPGSPLVVTKTSRSAGPISQSLSSTDTSTTVERQ